MQYTLNYILENYLKAKNENIKGNIIANYINKDALDNIRIKSNIDTSKYKLKGSAGQGRWADIPWIAVFDKDITTTATKGYDIVYLFCADMSGVYISLNQGWTYFKNKYGVKDGRKKIKLISNAWKNILSSTLSDFSFEPINLKGISKNSDLAEGYELGHICGKFYESRKIPNDSELINDLRNLLGVYRELKGHLKDNSIEKTNNSLIVNYDLGLLNNKNSEEDLNDIDDTIENFERSFVLIEDHPPLDFSSKDDNNLEFRTRKIDFLSKAKNQKKLGFAGELMVIKYEKEKLIVNGREDLSEQIKHVAKENGDGAGYDILSFEIDGTKKFIEVKTTTKDKSTPFIISSNEVRFSELNSSSYYLYRIFDFNKQNSTGKLFILHGDISKMLKLKSIQYIVNGILINSANTTE
ncbi:DUF3578 domain-containing protein [Clostridium sp. Mt-5]|uniref:DUF3578 domain-containing protein n=1 Tax=Clostridium moutaii TaxID=3240932 RepID=A0ABV4BIP9_9CLOT